MSTKYYVESTEVEGRRFQIVDFDKATMVATLQQGDHAPFEQSLAPEVLKDFGYRVIRVEEPDDAEQPELQT